LCGGSLPPGGARESNGDRKRAPKAFEMLFKGSLSAAEADAARVAGFFPAWRSLCLMRRSSEGTGLGEHLGPASGGPEVHEICYRTRDLLASPH
jgi:hypothetical protein